MDCTPEDIQEQWRVGRILARAKGREVHILNDKFSPYDGYLYDTHKRVTSWLEIKSRPDVFKYATLHVAIRKAHHLLVLEQFTGIPSYFVLADRNSDDVRFVRVEKLKNILVVHGGRRDRGKVNDEEAMFDVPRDLFTSVS